LHAAPSDPPPGADPEDRVLAVLMIVLGLARVVPAIAIGGTFGTEATIAALMLAAGVAILVIP
jgi:hypothetical protein